MYIIKIDRLYLNIDGVSGQHHALRFLDRATATVVASGIPGARIVTLTPRNTAEDIADNG